ncbi:MAG TPA: glutamate--tRNA ligase [Patescibacteria group bacterium]|nr:glutamate--tRNA ligase [Patescibacteria group bacterium]
MTNTNQPKIRTRFAPSPTGYVHIGNFRTALFSYLFAKHHGGDFILRIEDTDRARLVEGAVDSLLKVLNQFGIEPDEGFYLDSQGQVKERGSLGPYLQSERLPLYQKYALQLVEEKKAYYCYCSEQRLEDLRKEQVALKKPPMYDRHCRGLSAEQAQAEMERCRKEGRNPVIRQAIPQEGATIVHDVIYGEIRYENQLLDDQVLLKSDGFPTYHLAVVVDDHFMGITHITRSEEWIPSTPKHILLYQALGWQPPVFAHLPLILNPDKTKLSKRQGDVAVEDFLKKGYLPEALINFVAFLGWNPKTEREIFSLPELIAEFDLAKVNKSGAVFDIGKLDWLNGQYIRTTDPARLLELAKPYWQEAGIDQAGRADSYLMAIIALEKDRLKKLADIGEGTGFYFREPDYEPALLVWKKSTAADAKDKLAKLAELLQSLTDDGFAQPALEAAVKKFIADNNYDNGSVLWPLRVALTGRQFSPGPFEVCATLFLGIGKQGIIHRLNAALKKLA